MATKNASAARTVEQTETKEGVSSQKSAENLSAKSVLVQAETRSEGLMDNIPMGEVQEKEATAVSEDKGGSSGGSAQDDEGVTPVVDELEIPAPQVVVRKVKTALQKDIHELKKELSHYERYPLKYAHKLEEAVDLLRKMRNLLSDLMHQAFEYIQNLFVSLQQGKKMKALVAEL